jgi:hypothetical protein
VDIFNSTGGNNNYISTFAQTDVFLDGFLADISRAIPYNLYR